MRRTYKSLFWRATRPVNSTDCMIDGRYCLKRVIIDIFIYLYYILKNISTHSRNLPCLQDVWPAKTTACTFWAWLWNWLICHIILDWPHLSVLSQNSVLSVKKLKFKIKIKNYHTEYKQIDLCQGSKVKITFSKLAQICLLFSKTKLSTGWLKILNKNSL